MKCVTVPAPITLVDEEGKPILDPVTKHPLPAITLYSIVRDVALKNPAIGTGLDALEMVDRLKSALRDVREGDEVIVDDGDHKAVDRVFDAVQWGNPLIAAQQLPMIRAWKKATDEKRKLKAVEEKSEQT